MEQKEIFNYSDIKTGSEQVFPDAERIDQSQVLNKQVVILDFKILPSTISADTEFCVIKAEFENKIVSFSSGGVVGKQLSEVKEVGKFPLRTTIIKIKGKGKFGYYSLS